MKKMNTKHDVSMALDDARLSEFWFDMISIDPESKDPKGRRITPRHITVIERHREVKRLESLLRSMGGKP